MVLSWWFVFAWVYSTSSILLHLSNLYFEVNLTNSVSYLSNICCLYNKLISSSPFETFECLAFVL